MVSINASEVFHAMAAQRSPRALVLFLNVDSPEDPYHQVDDVRNESFQSVQSPSFRFCSYPIIRDRRVLQEVQGSPYGIARYRAIIMLYQQRQSQRLEADAEQMRGDDLGSRTVLWHVHNARERGREQVGPDRTWKKAPMTAEEIGRRGVHESKVKLMK